MPASGQPLTSLAAGTVATVAAIDLPAEDRTRLFELGLVAGTPIELVRFAPLGDPVEIKVRGSRLTPPRTEAEQIRVCANVLWRRLHARLP
jgi:ferrous iron transport protein A